MGNESEIGRINTYCTTASSKMKEKFAKTASQNDIRRLNPHPTETHP
jgi:hypothetical protein